MTTTTTVTQGPSEEWRALAQELLDAEEANRVRGATLANQSRLFRARRRLDGAMAVEHPA